jgi:outer membrane protein assembly factor BamB
MASEAVLALSRTQPARTEAAKPPRYWLGVVILAAFWAFEFSCRRIDLSMGVLFFSRLTALALLVLLFPIWWLTNCRVSRSDRWFAVAVTIAGAALATPFTLSTMGPALIGLGLPLVFTGGTLWLIASKRTTPRMRRLGLWATVWLIWGYCSLLRCTGLSGDQQPELYWRWEPTAEELFQAERNLSASDAPLNIGAAAVELTAGDWPEFRGPRRDGRVEERQLALNWKTSPPPLVWKKRVGPGWSSTIVAGGRLFTQEQHGQSEAVVCYEAATGRELWAHEEAGRFDESVSGPGPRATPTFAWGRIYATGAGGKLCCLDAASGKAIWSRDLVAETGATVPQWGFAGSPLVVEDLVVAFAGGAQDHGLLAFRAETGESVWKVATGKNTYSSPQWVLLGGTSQILFVSERGLIGIEPSSGVLLWEQSLSTGQALPAIQPHVVGDTGIVVQSGDGLSLVEVRHQDGAWSADLRWTSRALRPSFNDVVIHEGAIYGLDEGIFCCVDLQTGERRWKDGRYGHGQVLLLADQSVLLVISEKGEAVLVAADPEGHRELGRFQAIQGKTWNHPSIAHGRLYVRNGEVMACYELKSTTTR